MSVPESEISTSDFEVLYIECDEPASEPVSKRPEEYEEYFLTRQRPPGMDEYSCTQVAPKLEGQVYMWSFFNSMSSFTMINSRRKCKVAFAAKDHVRTIPSRLP